MSLLPKEPRQSLLPLELEEAMESGQPVRMEYLDGRQNRTHRVIRPLQIRRRNGEMILIAHCDLRNDQRTFKIERIVRLTRHSEIENTLFTTEITESTEKCERGEGLGLNSKTTDSSSVISVSSALKNSSDPAPEPCNSDPAGA
jgi:predicted DNA-binding transcriptional regulator YafY